MAFKIIVDSCCDARSVTSANIPVTHAPLRINIDGKSYDDDGSLNTVWLISAMRGSKNQPTTSCPSPAEYAEAMSGDDDCFVVTLSANLSGSYQAAVAGADLKTGSGRVHIFNSRSASAGEARIAEEIAYRVSLGHDFDQIVEGVEKYLRSMRTFFVLENLDYLIKAGRIGKFSGQLATIMQIRPIMGEDGEGNIIPLAKIRGTKNALNKMIDLIAEQDQKMRSEGRPQKPLVISHCNCPERAIEVKKAIMQKCPLITDITIHPTGGLSTFYAFDGGIVVAY